MKSFHRLVRAAAALTIVLASSAQAAHAQAQTLTFDDVPTNASGFNSGTFGSYQGYEFENFGVLTTSAAGTGANAASGTKFAYAQADGSSFIYRNSEPGFNLFDGFLSYRQFGATPPGPLAITVYGYRAGEASAAYQTEVLLTNSAQLFNFNFINVEEVEFATQDLQANGVSAVLAVDNLRLEVVPEPSTVSLFAIGMGGVLMIVRRRRYRSN